MSVMTEMTVTAARNKLADVIDDARVTHAPVFLTRRGRRVAAVIDADDLERPCRDRRARHHPLGRGQG